MGDSFLERLRIHKEKVKSYVEIADFAFLGVRIIIFFGGLGWLVFSDLSPETFDDVSNLIVFFVIYSTLIYFCLLFFPKTKKIIYIFPLILDLIFASLLVNVTGGFESSFFNGFYLITALYSFYFGLKTGAAIALISAVLYFVSGNYDFSKLYWTDFLVRVAFLFLMAIPLGILSQKLQRGKEKIEHLNKELKESLVGLREIQGRLVQAEKLSAVGRLIADVTHEIRNPLTSIGGFVRRLDKILIEDSKEKEYTDIILSEVDRLEKILRDVLTFSSERESSMKDQDINTAVKESLITFKDICDEQSIRIKEELNLSLSYVVIDKDQMKQAINNLISNAIDAMPSGGILKIKTFTQILHEVNYIVVEVADTGPGIPEKELNVIFEAFHTTKKLGVGTGLGLSIVKQIVDEHNGLIRVESKLGEGTAFKIYIPYQLESDADKIKCWEFTKCGVEKAEGAAEMRCRAYPNYGRICWAVAGTFCGRKVSGAIAQKLGDCKKCQFYKRVAIRKDL